MLVFKLVNYHIIYDNGIYGCEIMKSVVKLSFLLLIFNVI